MNRSNRKTIACVAASSCVVAWLSVGPWPGASAQATFPDPNANCPPSECGQVSPFIPMHSAEAVHMGLVWKKDSQKPKILFHARFPQYVPNDIADPALSRPGNRTGRLHDAGPPVRHVSKGRSPWLRSVPRSRDESLSRRLVPETDLRRLLMRQGLSQSVPTRILANRTMERQLLFDINHPHAFKNHGKFHMALLDEADFALNRDAFEENGYSKGMFYNTVLQRARDVGRRAGLRLRRSRHAERQRLVQGQHLRPGDRNVGQTVGAVRPIELDARIRSDYSCSLGTRTPSPISAAIRGTSRARNPPTRPTRNTPAGILGGCAPERPGAGPRRIRPGQHGRARS